MLPTNNSNLGTMRTTFLICDARYRLAKSKSQQSIAFQLSQHIKVNSHRRTHNSDFHRHDDDVNGAIGW